jgi:hypothetical protein
MSTIITEVPVIKIKVIELQGPRGSTGATGPVGPSGSDADIPDNISAFVNDIGYITRDSADTLTNKVWNGQLIADAYIASAAGWNAKQNSLGYLPENSANRGAINGYCPLDGSAIIPSIFLPSSIDEVIEYSNLASFPATGVAGKVYVALDSNKQYRWSGSTYIQLSPSPGSTDQVPEGSVNLYYTVARVQAALVGYPNSVFTNNAGYLTLGTLPAYPVVPTNNSAFTNDMGYYNVSNSPQIALNGSVGINVDGGGVIATTGQKGFVRMPYNATIYAWSILSDAVTNCQFDVWKRQTNMPDSSYSICGSSKPVLTGAQTGFSSTLTGWTNTAILANDIIAWNLDTNSSATKLILQLFLKP